MHITDVKTYPVRIPLKPEFRMVSALGAHDVSDYVVLRLLTDTGAEGFGEATISARWSGETIWSVLGLIEHLLVPAIRGCDPHDVVEVDRRMDAVCKHNWFAKSAIEMACWDVQGKAAGKPVYELLGGACRALEIRGRFSMGAYDVRRARRRAQELVEAGFTTIKVKVGGIPDQDIERVRAVREVIGEDKALVIDANCGWDADTAIHCIRSLEDCNLALVEQPTPDGDYGGMARVRRETGAKIMADDICFNLIHARELIRNQCCDVISLYPGKNGGIRKAREIADYAEQHDVACTIGSNLEWELGTAAMAHLVVATPNMKVEDYPGDIYGPVYHESRIAKNPLTIEGPITTITDQAGLGIDVDWDVLERHALPG